MNISYLRNGIKAFHMIIMYLNGNKSMERVKDTQDPNCWSWIVSV